MAVPVGYDIGLQHASVNGGVAVGLLLDESGMTMRLRTIRRWLRRLMSPPAGLRRSQATGLVRGPTVRGCSFGPTCSNAITRPQPKHLHAPHAPAAFAATTTARRSS